jgi:hypothetical protein
MIESFDISDPEQKKTAIGLIQSIPQDQVTIRNNDGLDNDTILVDPNEGIIELSPAMSRSCHFFTRRFPGKN